MKSETHVKVRIEETQTAILRTLDLILKKVLGKLVVSGHIPLTAGERLLKRV